MLGKTVQSGKSQAPCYTVTGRSKIGSFHEDLQKVSPVRADYNLNLMGGWRSLKYSVLKLVVWGSKWIAFLLSKHQKKKSLKTEPKPRKGSLIYFINRFFLDAWPR